MEKVANFGAFLMHFLHNLRHPTRFGAHIGYTQCLQLPLWHFWTICDIPVCHLGWKIKDKCTFIWCFFQNWSWRPNPRSNFQVDAGWRTCVSTQILPARPLSLETFGGYIKYLHLQEMFMMARAWKGVLIWNFHPKCVEFRQKTQISGHYTGIASENLA